MAIKTEAELYGPVRGFFEGRGFEVRGEVEGCDLVAVRGDDVVVVELKRSFNLALVLQGIDRQRITDDVFLAVEAPRRRPRYNWGEVHRLCRKLGLGLITVAFGRAVGAGRRNGRRGRRSPPLPPLGKGGSEWVPVDGTGRRRKVEVYVELEPGPYRPRKSKWRREGLLTEFNGRSGDYNTGGTTGRPIVTAYREEALRVAHALRGLGEGRPAQLREAAASRKAGSILLNNFYGWFDRVKHGTYQLTAEGEAALEKYADVVENGNGDTTP